MSWLKKAFGAPKTDVASVGGPPGLSESQKALAALNERIEFMDKKIEHLEKLAREEQKKAKTIGTKTEEAKKRAKRCLLQYKRYQQQIKQIEGQRDNMDAQKSALDMSIMAAGNIGAMSHASKATAKTIDIDKAEEIVDDIQDQMERVNEVTEALSRPMAGSVSVDDDELEDELNDFLADEDDVDELTRELGSVDTDALPSVDILEPLPNPVTKKPQKTEEQNQLDDLAAWMN